MESHFYHPPSAPKPQDSPSNHYCTVQDCGSKAQVQCAYVDRRGDECESFWCNNHVVEYENNPYCRRHIGIIKAVAESPLQDFALPDVHNRAPSLTKWVADTIKDRTGTKMKNVNKAHPEWVLAVDTLRPIFTGAVQRVRAWDYSWKLSDYTGVLLRVSVQVEEKFDHELIVKVNSEVMSRTTPPWVEHHLKHENISEAQDKEERAEFENFILKKIDAGINLALHKLEHEEEI